MIYLKDNLYYPNQFDLFYLELYPQESLYLQLEHHHFLILVYHLLYHLIHYYLCKILYILRRNDGIVQKDLADYCGIRQSTLTVLLTKMETQGLICREACYISGGKRAFRILLTNEGHAIADRLEEVVEELEAKCFSGFSEKEREQLLNMLTKVEGNIKDEK